MAAILQNDHSEILIAERADVAGAWQFPQGTVEPEEGLEQALERELREELSLQPRDFEVVQQKGPYRYEYRDTGNVVRGKEQHYFLCKFTAPESRVDVQTAQPEFRAVRWIKPEDFELQWLPRMKRQVYRRVLQDFFNVEK